jgi:hypothetical protein
MFYEISDRFQKDRINENDQALIYNFLLCLEGFNSYVDNLDKLSLKIIIENMKIKCYSKGKIIYRKG